MSPAMTVWISSFTATEWKILLFLAEREGRVVNREQLLGMCLDYLAEGLNEASTPI